MSKAVLTPLNIENQEKKQGILLQILSVLEYFKTQKKDRMLRLSSEISGILCDEGKFQKILNVKNLEGLLGILTKIQKNEMLKIYDKDYLKAHFPELAKSQFIL